MQALDRLHGLARQNHSAPHRFHAEHSNSFFYKNRQNLMLETVEMGVHDVQGHLHRVELKSMLRSHCQHPKMDRRVLVTRKSDVTNLAGLPGLDHRFHATTRPKDALGVFHSNNLVELQEINVVGIQAPKGFLNLLAGGGFRPPIYLGHEEDLLPVAVTQGLAHAQLTATPMIIPTIVHENDPAVDGAVDDPDPFGFLSEHSNVITPHAE